MNNLFTEKKCPCGSDKEYNNCCGKFHSTKSSPNTAEELMRSRYSAFVNRLADYLIQTLHPDESKKAKNRLSYSQLDQTSWLKLDVMKISQGRKTDKVGRVEFKAHYIKDSEVCIHHELSRFKKHNGIWYYLDGTILINN
jgi:SEC-C motif domain protein